jgi:hypothetical protein
LSLFFAAEGSGGGGFEVSLEVETGPGDDDGVAGGGDDDAAGTFTEARGAGGGDEDATAGGRDDGDDATAGGRDDGDDATAGGRAEEVAFAGSGGGGAEGACVEAGDAAGIASDGTKRSAPCGGAWPSEPTEPTSCACARFRTFL